MRSRIVVAVASGVQKVVGGELRVRMGTRGGWTRRLRTRLDGWRE